MSDPTVTPPTAGDSLVGIDRSDSESREGDACDLPGETGDDPPLLYDADNDVPDEDNYDPARTGDPDDDGYFTEMLERPLSDERFDEVVHELTSALRTRARTKDAASAAAKKYRGEVEALDAKVNSLITTIETCKERVDVRCRRVAHPERPFWQYVRTDTGQVYDEDPMSENEVVEQRQMSLPLSQDEAPHGVGPAGHAGAEVEQRPGTSPAPACVTGDPPGPPIGVLRALFPQEHMAHEPNAIIEVSGEACAGGESYMTLRCRECGAIAEIGTARYQAAISAHFGGVRHGNTEGLMDVES